MNTSFHRFQKVSSMILLRIFCQYKNLPIFFTGLVFQIVLQNLHASYSYFKQISLILTKWYSSFILSSSPDILSFTWSTGEAFHWTFYFIYWSFHFYHFFQLGFPLVFLHFFKYIFTSWVDFLFSFSCSHSFGIPLGVNLFFIDCFEGIIFL